MNNLLKNPHIKESSKTLTLFEQRNIEYSQLGLLPEDPLIEALDHLNKQSGRELITLERKSLRTTQFVGVIKVLNYTIQILPKIDTEPESVLEEIIDSPLYQKASLSAAKNFLYMLSYVKSINLHTQSIASLNKSEGSWIELLTRLFATELITQFRAGFHQDYVFREEELPFIRGKWDIAKQYSQKPILSEGLFVQHYDYLPDILLNQVFKFSVHELKRITQDAQNRQLLTLLESWLQPVKLNYRINKEILRDVKFNRVNNRFLPAFELSKMFLEGLSVHLMLGGQRAFAFVFDMNLLFEQFISNYLTKYSQLILPITINEYQIELQAKKTARYLIQPLPKPETPMIRLEPDILIKKDGIPVLIIDTKNKLLTPAKHYRSIAPSDVYQMIAYTTQFNCSSILLLYPQSRFFESKRIKLLSVEGTPINIIIATINLHLPINNKKILVKEFQNIFSNVFSLLSG